ncbi:hypothetical protein A1QO_03860 [Vibrio genomosp. F10 str. ZF-129]|uniref:Uncharacterized protein n=1 Tax=Vibrio genomosp. F10 str. ZF-129 TaxID=1187848 RepID=A0A1E5BIK3_9VIBR|nr:hypothetical protein [Vibrio genomosp. F10]OEE37248.1 hypothetical protein A1QO_03860 [Vibrio genomosp. F10 str. ZF-129]
MQNWVLKDDNIHQLKISEAFIIEINAVEGYAICTGIDGKIGLIDGHLEEQKRNVIKVVKAIFGDILQNLGD